MTYSKVNSCTNRELFVHALIVGVPTAANYCFCGALPAGLTFSGLIGVDHLINSPEKRLTSQLASKITKAGLLKTGALASVSAAAWKYFGPKAGLLTLGAVSACNYFFGSSKSRPTSTASRDLQFLRAYIPPLQRPPFPERAAEIRFDPRLSIEPKQKAPPQIVWRDNSCFVSSAMWSFFLNEPTVLREIPNAITRRLPLAANWVRSLILAGSSQYLGLNDRLNHILQGESSITAETLRELLGVLKSSPFVGLGRVEQSRLNELISLLELHRLVYDCQNNDSIPGDTINEVRQMVRRVDDQFKDMGDRIGDSHELMIALGNMIFEGSAFHQSENVLRHCLPYSPGTYTLNPRAFDDEIADQGGFYSRLAGTFRTPEYQLSRSFNWGHLALTSGKRNLTVKEILKNHTSESRFSLEEAPQYDAFSMDEKSFEGRRHFDTTQRSLLDEPPPVLVLNFKDPFVEKRVEEELVIHEEDGIFKRGEAKYILAGVSRHGETFAHYDTTIRAPDGHIYYCNDLGYRDKGGDAKPLRVDASWLKESGKTGYILIYRKVN